MPTGQLLTVIILKLMGGLNHLTSFSHKTFVVSPDETFKINPNLDPDRCCLPVLYVGSHSAYTNPSISPISLSAGQEKQLIDKWERNPMYDSREDLVYTQMPPSLR